MRVPVRGLALHIITHEVTIWCCKCRLCGGGHSRGEGGSTGPRMRPPPPPQGGLRPAVCCQRYPPTLEVHGSDGPRMVYGNQKRPKEIFVYGL